LTPDIPFYDGDFADPQSLNLYSYVGNNPLTRIDLNGHDYRVCPTGGQCVILTNQQYEDAINGKGNDGIKAPAFGQSGSITCSGKVCGSAQYLDLGAVTPGDDFIGAIAGGMVAGKVTDAIVGTVAGWFGRGTGDVAGDVASNAAAGTTRTFQEIWDSATPVQGTSRVATREMTGGFAQAQRDFDSLPGTSEKTGRVWIKNLPNGEGRAVLRDFSSPATGNRPTLELQPVGGGFKGMAIRYNP
jgi:hypothetical protein